MKTATYLRRLEAAVGDARLYRLDPPLIRRSYDETPEESHEYVVVSATVYDGPETLIFGATEDGVIDLSELTGFRGSLDHAEALRRVGYAIEEARPPMLAASRKELRVCTKDHGGDHNAATVYGHHSSVRVCIKVKKTGQWVYDPAWETRD